MYTKIKVSLDKFDSPGRKRKEELESSSVNSDNDFDKENAEQTGPGGPPMRVERLSWRRIS